MPLPDPPAAEPRAETLGRLGEGELIRRLGRFTSPGRLDDDAALLVPPQEKALVVTSDVLVDEVHFSDSTTAPADVGWRATAANLSDLAAMGCSEGLGITVALTAPGSTLWSWVEGVYGGIQAVLHSSQGGELLGGDCSGGLQRQLAITALGAVNPGQAIRRGDGRPGDLLVSSGPHGLSRLGLALLIGELDRQTLAGVGEELKARALRAHRRPRPRFDVVRALRRARPETTAWRVGGTDSSDGLLAAATAIATVSGCTAVLGPAALPLDPEMASLPQARSWCLAGGEDFELLLALKPTWARALCAQQHGCRLVGELRLPAAAGSPPVVWSGSGATVEVAGGAYRHFQEGIQQQNSRPCQGG